MFHFYALLSSNVQNCIRALEKISHFVFYVIRFILSGDTRLYKISNISSVSQSKIESTSSSFITFHLCAFCNGILFGASAHLFTCNLHRWSPSSCCLWTQANSSSVLLKLSVTALCTSERQTNKCTVYSPKCILYNTFYQWCPSDCKPYFRALTITIW